MSRVVGPTLALKEVFPSFEYLVRARHHGDVLGGIDGQIVFDACLPCGGKLPLLGELLKVRAIGTIN